MQNQQSAASSWPWAKKFPGPLPVALLPAGTSFYGRWAAVGIPTSFLFCVFLCNFLVFSLLLLFYCNLYLAYKKKKLKKKERRKLKKNRTVKVQVSMNQWKNNAHSNICEGFSMLVWLTFSGPQFVFLNEGAQKIRVHTFSFNWEYPCDSWNILVVWFTNAITSNVSHVDWSRANWCWISPIVVDFFLFIFFEWVLT